MEGVEINTSESEHKENSSKEKFDNEKAEFGKTNEKCMSNEMNVASQGVQFSKTTPDNNNRAGRKPENEEHRECESGTSKERKRKFESEEENNQTWRAGSYRQEKKVNKRAEFTNRRNRRQYSRKSSAKTYGTITRRRKSEELQNNRGQVRDCTRDDIWMKLKELERTIKGLQSTANLRFLVQNRNTETDAAQYNMDEKINLFLEEQKNIFRTILSVNSSQLQNTKEDTRAHNSGTVKINRICKGKDKEIIAESSKKVFSKEDWSMEKDLIHKKNGSSLVDQIKAGKHLEPILQISRWMRFIRDRLGHPIEETDKLEFNLTIEKINTDLQLEIQQAEDI
ncbi:11889_t:CDS:2 [Gigaspora margarita]|uniref:11889_t:CDS:1 n=1 Tax=Gigaspora margarita TaxID=4874 RepID=A0ABN7VQT7_GIGMA|nr:11889_t:CDS:2 [Gigaspora margarita]